MILVLSCICLGPIYWSQVLSREWRCSWSSANRRCSNYIWVINNLIAYYGASYIRDLTVLLLTHWGRQFPDGWGSGQSLGGRVLDGRRRLGKNAWSKIWKYVVYLRPALRIDCHGDHLWRTVDRSLPRLTGAFLRAWLHLRHGVYWGCTPAPLTKLDLIEDWTISNSFSWMKMHIFQGSTLRVVRSSNPTWFVRTSWVGNLVVQF